MPNLDVARDRGSQLSARVKRQHVAIRSAFIVSSDPKTPPPLTSILRGGRGGEVKLKLLLSMLWIGAKEPYDVTQPARVWAELIGLDEPSTKGAARVNAAARRLVEGKFLTVEKRPGQPSRLFLQNELGTGITYTHPGSHWRKADPGPSASAPRYTQLPVSLWTNGWVADLSAPALAMFLVLLEQTRGKNYHDLWFSPSVAAKRYGLSEVTRRKGLAELELKGIILIDQAPVGRGTLSEIRRRNTYSVYLDRLDQRPEKRTTLMEWTTLNNQKAKRDFDATVQAMKLHRVGADPAGTAEPKSPTP